MPVWLLPPRLVRPFEKASERPAGRQSWARQTLIVKSAAFARGLAFSMKPAARVLFCLVVAFLGTSVANAAEPAAATAPAASAPAAADPAKGATISANVCV